MKGSYVLFIHLDLDKKIQIGKLGSIQFKKGWYVYVGSALNSLKPRIKRHLRKHKKIHWHIDYLLEEASILDIYFKEGLEKIECDIASIFSHEVTEISSFGSSDCTCKSHLFYGGKDELQNIIDGLQFTQFIE